MSLGEILDVFLILLMRSWISFASVGARKMNYLNLYEKKKKKFPSDRKF